MRKCRGEMRVPGVAAWHQRLAWIHPFRDGNGRVARLHTHLALGHVGLANGLWSPLRGFARSQETYYALLAAADEPRAGDLDGRGNLSERALCKWMAYVLGLCIEQVLVFRSMRCGFISRGCGQRWRQGFSRKWNARGRRVWIIHTMTSAELIKRMLKAGWVLRGTKGSHHVFVHPRVSGHVSVPHPRKDMGVGLLHKLLRQTGLDI